MKHTLFLTFIFCFFLGSSLAQAAAHCSCILIAIGTPDPHFALVHYDNYYDGHTGFSVLQEIHGNDETARLSCKKLFSELEKLEICFPKSP
jgi:hypothetical protein